MVALSFGLDDWDVEVQSYNEATVVSARTETKYGLTITYTPLMVVTEPELITVDNIRDTIAYREALAGGLL